jgi:hypothetical protein
MPLHYRYIAKRQLEKATALLETNDDDKLKYACLELRQCLEALAYELLTGYLKEVPLKALATWQPAKVMKELLRIDPRADRTAGLRMRRDGHDGEPDGQWIDLGEDRRMDAKRLAKGYHQLGSFLHVPTIKQVQQDEPFDATAAREKATELKNEIQHVLDAQIWNANFSVSVAFDCSLCKALIKRRVSVLAMGNDVECGNCGQLFCPEKQTNGSYHFIPRCFDWNCDVCAAPQSLAQGQAQDGLDVSCSHCKDPVTLRVRQQWELVRHKALEEKPTEKTAEPDAA